MPRKMLLNFKPRFIDPIKIGTKVHTLRKRRKLQPKVGETMHMYSGLRTNRCQLISKDEKIISIQRVFIRFHFIGLTEKSLQIETKICVEGRALSMDEMQAFARFDGFKHLTDFSKFWILDVIKNTKMKLFKGHPYKYVFSGFCYHWTDLKY